MKFHNFAIFLLIAFSFSIFIFQGVSTEGVSNMDDNGTVPTGRNVPEHIPGSNMIGAGRGRRVQDWKKGQAGTDNIPQQPPNQPQQHDATVPADNKK